MERFATPSVPFAERRIINMKIGEEIYKLRKEKMMTQSEFAELFTVSRQAVSNWENNKSYPDLEIIIKISDKFNISLDRLLKEDVDMVRTVDRNKSITKILKFAVIAFIIAGVAFGIYAGICSYQQKVMYDNVFLTGFQKENTEEFMEKYQGYYALTEDGVDYLVEPKMIGSLELDTQNFVLVARKGKQDIVVRILADGKITLGLHPGTIIVDKDGNASKESVEELTVKQRENFDDLLETRKTETTTIIKNAIKKWKQVNNIS